MLVKTYGSAVFGVNAHKITIEVNIGQGQLNYFMVGLPDNAVKESQLRIETAVKNNGFKMPRERVVVNMAPADIRKEGSAYDLSIATGILAASGQVNADKLEQFVIMGELSLDGGVLPIKGALPIAVQAIKDGFKGIILPAQNAREAAIVKDLEVYGVQNLAQLVGFLNGDSVIERTIADPRKDYEDQNGVFAVDFADVQGQENIKRAMEIAAAGGHNIIVIRYNNTGVFFY